MTMPIKLPKYVSLKRSSYHYQRAYPTKLLQLAPSRFYSAALNLKVGASELEIFKAADAINKNFDLHCRTLENSDPNLYDDDAIDTLARKFLKDRNLEEAGLADFKVDPVKRAREEYTGVKEQAEASDIADALIPEINGLSDLVYTNREMSLDEKVVAKAHKLLLQPKKAKALKLSQLWQLYLDNKDSLPSQRDVKRITNRWERFLSFCGDGLLNQESYATLEDALHEYVSVRRGESVTEATIKRELAEVLACLNFGAKRLRLQWHLSQPSFKFHEPAEKLVFTLPEQVKLISYCLNPPKRFGKHAAIAILGMLGGMMVSEIEKLTGNSVQLDGQYPYVTLIKRGKTRARKRVIPVVFGADVLAKYLTEATTWLSETTHDNAGQLVNKMIQKVTGNGKLTMHCCRHTFRMNASRAGVDITAMNEIGGWTDGARVSHAMLKYGAAALQNTDYLAHLFGQSQRIHAELLCECRRIVAVPSQQQIDPE